MRSGSIERSSLKTWSRLGLIVATALVGASVVKTSAFANATVVSPTPAPLSGTAHTLERPRVLGSEDTARYVRIFELQDEARWAEAEREIARVKDPVLLGHLLAQRYLHPKYRSTYAELTGWLDEHGDHPLAERLHKLALSRLPAGQKAPPAPILPDLGDLALDLPAAIEDKAYVSPRRATPEEARPLIALQKGILEQIQADKPAQAEAALQKPEIKALLEPAEFDDLQQRIAARYLFDGEDDKAFRLARQAADRSGEAVPHSHWIAGLAAWRLKDYGQAQRHFAQLAALPNISAWDHTAGAFWAARAALRNRKPAEANRHLAQAATYPRTFYGLLAARQLGKPISFAWNQAALQARDLADLAERVPGVRRAIALTEVGRGELAGLELRRLYARANDDLAGVLIHLASKLDAPAAAMRLALQVRDARGAYHDSALYPVPPWRPESGFMVDRALLFAFMRQESGFDTKAKSGAGATGLMQLMPRTAAQVSQDKSLGDRNRDRLYQPAVNMDLGQRYLQQLLGQEPVKGNLILLAAAYNAGPAAAQRWLRTVRHGGDPLLFVETIPVRETRLFIERVLTNFWIYRARLGQDEPSLDALAGGKWPYYIGLDDSAYALNDIETE